MRKLLTLLFTFSGLTAATLSYAASGVVDITWGGVCTPIVTDITPTAAAPASMMVSVLGNDETHSAYQVRFLIASAAQTVPDAWRFDAAGCQGTALLTINHLPPALASKTCPAFQGALQSLQIKDYSFLVGTGYPSTEVRGVLANTYPDGNTTLAATRYFLAQFIFDHSFSVVGPGSPGLTCGGLETPMCIALLTGPGGARPAEGSTTYIRHPSLEEVAFDFGNRALWTHSLAGCPAVPAENKTWGQIKSRYRN